MPISTLLAIAAWVLTLLTCPAACMGMGYVTAFLAIVLGIAAAITGSAEQPRNMPAIVGGLTAAGSHIVLFAIAMVMGVGLLGLFLAQS